MLMSKPGISKTGISNQELENGIIASPKIIPTTTPITTSQTHTPPQPPHPYLLPNTHTNEIQEALRLIQNTCLRDSRKPYARLMTFTLKIGTC